MKILLTGANGYIGKRLLPVLLQQGHDVVCCVRDVSRFSKTDHYKDVGVVEVDFLDDPQPDIFPEQIDAAYYLIHSMSSSIDDFEDLEVKAAGHFVRYMDGTAARQIVYLSGIDSGSQLSRHLRSRRKVEEVLRGGRVPVTVLKAGIIVGSGSASFEIIRDLVEKLPVMIAPKWLNSQCQPIAVRNAIDYLTGVLEKDACVGKVFEICGTEVLTYKQMLKQYAEVRGLRRFISTVPVMTPRLSSYWLYFITSTSFRLAVNLVNSMKTDVVCSDDKIRELVPVSLISYKEAIARAFDRIDQNMIISSWKDSLISSSRKASITQWIQVPRHGCFSNVHEVRIRGDVSKVMDRIWSIGGETGWYYGTVLWKFRGFIDTLAGGTGLRRGRTHPADIHTGDALDFWRVLVADRKNQRLLLYAEMKLPGEAWLEFRIDHRHDGHYLVQTATFRPSGVSGRIYWHFLLPAHYFIFRGMAKKVAGR